MRRVLAWRDEGLTLAEMAKRLDAGGFRNQSDAPPTINNVSYLIKKAEGEKPKRIVVKAVPTAPLILAAPSEAPLPPTIVDRAIPTSPDAPKPKSSADPTERKIQIAQEILAMRSMSVSDRANIAAKILMS